MKETTVRYFCDKCKEEIKDEPNRNIYIDYTKTSARVSIEYRHHTGECEYENSMLCDKCKKELLKEALKRLKKK